MWSSSWVRVPPRRRVRDLADKPRCDFCGRLAVYDAKTIMGPWAYVCQKHFDQLAVKEPAGLYTKLNKEENDNG